MSSKYLGEKLNGEYGKFLLGHTVIILVCNITNNIDALIDKRLVRFIYSSINHTNKTSSNILRVKLLCVNSTFSANFQYLSFKYGLTEADWYINIDHLMGKVRKKCL